MRREIIICGAGGQGVVLAGELLSQALFEAGYEVVNTRSYGAEARGGRCRSEIIVSDEEIHDIQLLKVDILVVMSVPAYRRYIERVRRGGLVLLDEKVLKGLKKEEVRGDVEIVSIPASEIASRLGNPIVANMVLLGSLLKKTALIPLERLKASVSGWVRTSMREINLKALEEGYGVV
jgi:2-oxoglutarate ferredoxin oxidoreductase subunit gamma